MKGAEILKKGLILFLLACLLVFTCCAYEDKTIKELTDEISKISTDSKYPESGQIKQTCLSWLYGKDRDIIDTDINKFTYNTKAYIENLVAIDGMRNDNDAQRDNILKKSPEVITIISQMEGTYKSKLYSEKDAGRIVDHSKQSMIKILEENEKYFERKGDNEKITPIKIEYLEKAVECYEETLSIGGNVQSNINKKFLDMKDNFNMDLNKANDLWQEGKNLIYNEENKEKIGALDSAINKFDEAESIYKKHNLDSLNDNKKYTEYYNDYSKIISDKEKAVELRSGLVRDSYIILGIGFSVAILTAYLFISAIIDYKKDKNEEIMPSKIFED